jgi:hypothetical protein
MRVKVNKQRYESPLCLNLNRENQKSLAIRRDFPRCELSVVVLCFLCFTLLLSLIGSLSLSTTTSTTTTPSSLTLESLVITSSAIHEAYAQTEDNNNNNTNSLSSYTDPPTGVTFQYPSSWEILDVIPSLLPAETISAIRLVPPGQNTTEGFVDNVIISALRIPNMTLGQFTDETIAAYNNNLSDTVTITNSEPTTLSSNSAHSIEFLEDYQGQQLNKMQVWTLIGDRVYLLTYGADRSEFPQHLADVQAIIESLQISDAGQGQQQLSPPREQGFLAPFFSRV